MITVYTIPRTGTMTLWEFLKHNGLDCRARHIDDPPYENEGKYIAVAREPTLWRGDASLWQPYIDDVERMNALVVVIEQPDFAALAAYCGIELDTSRWKHQRTGKARAGDPAPESAYRWYEWQLSLLS